MQTDPARVAIWGSPKIRGTILGGPLSYIGVYVGVPLFWETTISGLGLSFGATLKVRDTLETVRDVSGLEKGLKPAAYQYHSYFGIIWGYRGTLI